MDLTPAQQFAEFCYERQLIWHRKEVLGLPRPWTEDKYLQNYHFCNLYRELDKGTRYLLERVTHNPNLSPANKIFNSVAYRFFNSYGTFEDIFEGLLDVETFDWKHYEALIDSKKAKGQKLFHIAYRVVPQGPSREYRPSSKHVQVLIVLDMLKKWMLEGDWIQKISRAETPEESFLYFLDIPMAGPFLAYEFWQDAMYTGHWNWTDDDFVSPGPGATWCLDLMEGRKLPNKEYVPYLIRLRDQQTELFEELKQRTGKNWLDIHYSGAFSNSPYLSLANIEQAACEYRKYLNLSNGKGRMRYYKP